MTRTGERDRDQAVTTRRRSAGVDDGALYAAQSRRHGRGVFAARRFRTGQIIYRCPVLTVSARERGILEETVVGSYLYERGRGGAIALGLGSLLNHSFDPNAACEMNDGDDVAEYRAIRPIQPGEEVTILYCDEADLWFEARDAADEAATNGSAPKSTSRRRSTKRRAPARGNGTRNGRTRSRG